MERIMCYECKTGDLVIAGEGCPAHISTKCQSLVLVALGQISKWYKMRSLQLSAKGHTIPFITIPGKPDQLYIVELNLGLKAHPWVRLKLPILVDQLLSEIRHLEYGSLISDLSVTDKAISPAGQPTHTIAPIIGNDTVRLIQNQKELNLIKQVTWDNSKLRDHKRKADVQTISFENFMRDKLVKAATEGPLTLAGSMT